MSEVKRYTFLGAFGDRGVAEPTQLVLATDFDATEAARVKAEAECDRLRDKYQRDVYGLNNEGDPIGGEPAGGYANENARLRAELAALKAQQAEQTPATVYSLLVKGMADALRHALKELDGETPEDIDYGQLYAALHAYEQFAPSPQPDAGGLPDVLFDGYAVYQEVERQRAGRNSRTSAENVSDTLDAVVSLLRAVAHDKQSGGDHA